MAKTRVGFLVYPIAGRFLRISPLEAGIYRLKQSWLDHKIGLMKNFRPLFVPAIVAAGLLGALFSHQCGATWATALGAGLCVFIVALIYAALGYAVGRSQ